MPPKPMTQEDLSVYLGVAEGTLENWRVRGLGPKFFRLGGSSRSPVRYDPKDVEEWVRSQPRLTSSSDDATTEPEAAR